MFWWLTLHPHILRKSSALKMYLISWLLWIPAKPQDQMGYISARLLKLSSHSIVPVLTELFKLSIKTGKIPQNWKISSIVPIPKSQTNTDDPCNYWPTSLLTVTDICSLVLRPHPAFHRSSTVKWVTESWTGPRYEAKTLSALCLDTWLIETWSLMRN